LARPRYSPKGAKRPAAKPVLRTLRIEALAHRGDGVAHLGEPGETGERREVFVPYTLPGETVEAELRGNDARLIRVVEPSPERAEPPCPHFTRCGGCAVQHLKSSAYERFKRDLLTEAMAQRGFDEVPVRSLTVLPSATRRRATFKAVRTHTGTVLGFAERKGATVIDLDVCPVLRPELVAALPALRALCDMALAPGQKGELYAWAGEAGLDVDLAADPDALSAKLRLRLAQWAEDHDIARLSLSGEMVAQRRAPILTVQGVPLMPRPSAFLQASQEAETRLRDLVLEGVFADGPGAPPKRVADLFCGLGVFSLALAERAQVLALDGDAPAIEAMARGLRDADRLGLSFRQIVPQARDLERRPLTPKELAKLDAVVFDPPRAGAQAQAEELAGSAVPRVVAVSCNPATLARDLRTLVEGGYRLHHIDLVDQFVWAAHIEAVAVLSRAA